MIISEGFQTGAFPDNTYRHQSLNVGRSVCKSGELQPVPEDWPINTRQLHFMCCGIPIFWCLLLRSDYSNFYLWRYPLKMLWMWDARSIDSLQKHSFLPSQMGSRDSSQAIFARLQPFIADPTPPKITLVLEAWLSCDTIRCNLVTSPAPCSQVFGHIWPGTSRVYSDGTSGSSSFSQGL